MKNFFSQNILSPKRSRFGDFFTVGISASAFAPDNASPNVCGTLTGCRKDRFLLQKNASANLSAGGVGKWTDVCRSDRKCDGSAALYRHADSCF